ncbi:hypothetical protein Gogos_000102, partial [Gossypium gossypioides]|nr:hypothetical protein [Gossypium gossypioides]
SSPIVFDISSDDDEATLAWEEPKGDDYDWLSEVLEAVDKGFDDLDEVVVVGEVNPTKKSKSSNSVARKVVDEDDGDCVVLEGDPDKALSDVNDPQQDSDECLIVGQKGQFQLVEAPTLWVNQCVVLLTGMHKVVPLCALRLRQFKGSSAYSGTCALDNIGLEKNETWRLAVFPQGGCYTVEL